MHSLVQRLSTLAPWKISILLGALVALISVAKYGIGTFPEWIYPYEIAANWRDPSQSGLMVPPADYLRSNFVAAWLAGLLGLLSSVEFFVFHLLLALIAIMLPFWLPVARSQPGVSRTLFIVVAGGSVSGFLLMWVSGYDAVTVIGLVIAALVRNPVLAGFGWFLAALNHTSMGIVALAVWLPIAFFSEPRSRAAVRSGLALVAVALGVGVNGVLMSAWGGSTSRWDWFLQREFSDFTQAYWMSMPIILFSALGVAWLLLLLPSVRRSRLAQVLMLEAVLLSIVLPIISLDATRTVSLGLFAALLTSVVAIQPRIQTSDPSFTMIGIAAAIVPVPVVWGGELMNIGWESFFTLDEALLPPEGYVLVE